jgi:protease PrsW
MDPRGPRPVLDSARFGRTPVVFLFGLAVCCLVAIVALAVVLTQRGPAPALVGLLLAVLPIPLLVAVVLYLDRLEPEPRALLAAIFGAGAGIAALTALAGRALHTGVVTIPELGPRVSMTAPVTVASAIGGALVTETLSGLVLLALLASRRTEIDGVEDGVVYGATLGLGFALVANLYGYAVAWNAGAGAVAEQFASRGIFGPVFLALFSSLIGIGVAYAAARPAGTWRYAAIGAGWVAAVILGALWNHAVALGTAGTLVTWVILVAALLATAVAVAADRRRLVTMITGFLPAFEHPEVVTPDDIRMLASPRLRRLGRQWARLNHGISGRRAMIEYQLAATELAMACRRKSLGQTSQDAFLRHRDDSLTLMRTAAALVREREQLMPPPWIGPDAPSVFVVDLGHPTWPGGPSWPGGA